MQREAVTAGNDIAADAAAARGVRGGGGALLWFEDLAIGQVFESREYEITQREIIEFGARFDPQPFHTDPVAARATFFRGLAASGWHTAAVTVRLVVEAVPLAWGVLGAGTDHLSWPKPTRPGDRIHVRSVVEHKRVSGSRPDRGLVLFRCTTLDHAGEVVQVIAPKLVVPLREYAMRQS